MRALFFFILLLETLLLSDQEIVNKTAEPMLCVASYPAVYAQEEIHGINQRVQVQQEERITMIVEPSKSFVRSREGQISCYNALTKVTSNSAQSLYKADERSLAAYVSQHEMFDIASYANENREFVDAKYGCSRSCKAYEGGEYCQKVNGLDILFDKDTRVKKLFIYGYALQNGQLPFEAASFNKISVNNEPLGLWVSDKNAKLIAKKPSYSSSNAIIWENPSKQIKRIVMTPRNGYLNFNDRWNNTKEAKLQDYLQAIEVEYVMDDKAYALQQKTRPLPVDQNSCRPLQPAPKLPKKAESTWGKHLNPKNEIPTNRFKAFYINTNSPDKVIASEVVDKVSVNYPWSDFHGIDSKDFGAYWVGNFTYGKKSPMEISIAQSWAKTRVIIDGMVVYEGSNSNAQFPYEFSKGKHKIEVEYVNNWHTTGFMLNIKEKEKIYSEKELREALSKLASKNSEVMFASVYESRAKDQSIELILAKHAKPVILVLNAYDAVEWRIKNAHKTKIEAVIYGAYKPGTQISGDLPKAVPIFPFEGHLGSYSMKQSCSCINGGALFHCEGTNAEATINRIESLTGKKVFGFSGTYGTDALLLPNTIVTEKTRAAFKAEMADVEKQRETCKKKTNPEFEKMFEK